MKRPKSLFTRQTPAIVPTLGNYPAPKADDDLKRLLYGERKLHAKLVRVLTQRIESQERQIDDLRRLYFQQMNLAVSGR